LWLLWLLWLLVECLLVGWLLVGWLWLSGCKGGCGVVVSGIEVTVVVVVIGV
jgi:hypothetical protein